MPVRDGKYNIKAVSKLLGIQPGTLRAWERRYGMISPGRSASGHRLYSESQVELLREIKAMIGQGFTVGQAVAHLGQQPVAQRIGKRPGGQLEEYRNNLLDAFRIFDDRSAHRTIDACLSEYTFETCLSNIFHPLLLDMEGALRKGSLNNACFLFGRALIRSRIERMALVASGNRLMPIVLLLCAPGEQNDVCLLMLAAFLRLKGFMVIYLGPGIAEDEIDGALTETDPRIVVFSCETESGAERILDLSYGWEELVPGIMIGAIGDGFRNTADQNTDNSVLPLYLGETPGEWEEWLNERLEMLKGDIKN
ncbi:MerR family transcriptional regulator [Neobacillus sp. YIM B06451]|uniref:MerR family transcriptional regulator n=1 Tax=Neobacillus sp. YIM B06451 TaxID=3070994 RepID=UPI00292F14C4|nr:MerR family transcriptional regulator [Neobacillus sp. YIM B06451]